MATEEEDVATCCTTCFYVLFIFTVAAVLGYVFIDVNTVEFTVDQASLEQLSLAAPGPGNGTASLSLSYNLSLAVAVRNPNWVARTWRTAPLDIELSLGGTRPFALVRLAAGGEPDCIRPGRSKVYRVAVAADGVPVALGSGDVAEFALERAAGVFRLELVVAGEFKIHTIGRFNTMVRCPLTLPLSTVPRAVAFAAFEHTLPPQPCVDVAN